MSRTGMVQGVSGSRHRTGRVKMWPASVHIAFGPPTRATRVVSLGIIVTPRSRPTLTGRQRAKAVAADVHLALSANHHCALISTNAHWWPDSRSCGCRRRPACCTGRLFAGTHESPSRSRARRRHGPDAWQPCHTSSRSCERPFNSWTCSRAAIGGGGASAVASRQHAARRR